MHGLHPPLARLGGITCLLLAACARDAPPADGNGGARASADVVPAAASAAASPRDTVRGVLAVSGAEPQWRLTLTTGTGVAYDIERAGGTATPQEELRAADHLEVTLLGNHELGAGEVPGARRFRMSSFLVRAVDGADAVDGILIREPAGYALRLMDGTALPITRLPASLERQVGARIYWAGATDLPPAAYGVLRPTVALRPPGH
jgi:hypothetical protein